MLTNPRDAMLDIYSVDIPVSLHLLQITEKLIARRSLLFKVQRVTSARLPRLRGLFSTHCRQNRVQTVCKLKYSRLLE